MTLFPRKIQKELNFWLNKPEIIFLNGSRQVGKTSILQLLQDELKKQRTDTSQIHYFNLEKIDILTELNQNPENLLKYITDKNQKNYFFIDEIQYLDNPSNFLKHLYDEYKDKIKLIVTGSSSLELKAKIQDSLVGRKINFKINPLTFEEFLSFKNSDIFRYFHQDSLPLDIQNKFQELLNEYLLFGGMPRVTLAANIAEKKTLLQNYVSDYINKDIRSIGKIDNLLGFNQLAKVLASQIGNLLNISELANTLNIKRKEIEFYLNLLEQTFILNRVSPYLTNIRSQITKMPKLYFGDLGIRNQILGNFTPMNSRTDAGALFENFAFLELCVQTDKNNIFFYRTIHQSEVDFVLEKDNLVYPIEVKYQTFTKPRNYRSLSSFCQASQTNCLKAYLLNLNLNQNQGQTEFIAFPNFVDKIFGED